MYWSNWLVVSYPWLMASPAFILSILMLPSFLWKTIWSLELIFDVKNAYLKLGGCDHIYCIPKQGSGLKSVSVVVITALDCFKVCKVVVRIVDFYLQWFHFVPYIVFRCYIGWRHNLWEKYFFICLFFFCPKSNGFSQNIPSP